MGSCRALPGGFLSGIAPLRFIPTGNLSRIVSYPTWCRCVSYRQETFCEWFPIRHSSIAFHHDRKLFAYSFLPGMAPLRFIPAGNFSHIVSCSAWLHCVSYRQENSRPEISRLRFAPLEMTERHVTIAFHLSRKPFAYSFLSDMIPSCFIAAGNFSRIVSCPAWLHCVSYRQETFCVSFPVRHGSIAFHTDRKLFAYGFPSGMTPLCFIAAGNYSQMVSCPAWLHCVSSQQETIREWFPVRHGSTMFHRGRKLFAYSFPSGMAPLRFIPAGNFLRMVSCPAWLHCVSYRQETFREWFPIRHGSIAFHLHRKLSPIRV